MNHEMLAVILFVVSAVTSNSAVELPAVQYIDVTNIDESSRLDQVSLGNYVETYGSENPEDTAKILRGYADSLGYLFSHKDKLSQNTKSTCDLYRHLVAINTLVGDPENQRDKSFGILLGIIKQFFGEDLDGFASGKITRLPRLRTFLLHNVRAILSEWLSRAVDRSNLQLWLEDPIKKVIVHDLQSGYTETDMLSKAQRINLVTDDFSAKSMLASLDGSTFSNKLKKYKPKKRLPLLLKEVCGSLSKLHGGDIEVYIWSRLLIPEEVSRLSSLKDMPKLVEYWRVCLPINNSRTYELVVSNVGRNCKSCR